MSYGKYSKSDSKAATYSSIVYYGPLDRSQEEDYILKKCEETNGNGFIEDDNTVYEIDCECYRSMQLRKAKRNEN